MKRTALMPWLLGACLACAATPSEPSDDLTDSTTDTLEAEAVSAAWPEDRRTPRRTGYNPYEATITRATAPTLHIDWRAPVAGHHLALGAGLLFVSGDTSGSVSALHPDSGAVAWTQPGPFVGPGAATRGSYTIGTGDARMAVLNAKTGNVERYFYGELGADPRVTPPLTSDGFVTFESDSYFEECVPHDAGEICESRRTVGFVSSYNVHGAERFRAYLPFGIGVPARAGDRIFVVGSDLSLLGSDVAAISAVDGSLLWQSEHAWESGAAPLHPPAVLHGRVFALVGSNWLRVHDEHDGRLLWEYRTQSDINSLIVSDASVFLLSGPDALGLHLEVLAPDMGTLVRSTTVSATRVTGEFIATRELLLGGVDDRLMILDARTLDIVSTLSLGGSVGSPVLVDGRLYIGNGTQILGLTP
ncbi:MAG: PQQ-binding-like beta-propeller repeat protein [Myxococcota bacterium]